MSADTLVISPKFTIEDIHKVRENNYNLTRDMSPQEKKITIIQKEWKCTN